jgi:GT2 family glycosyltransferase
MLAAVIVTWNSEAVIGRCLDSCLEAGVPEVIVVDNASLDRTVDAVARRPGVRLIASETNRGFAGAVNLGVSSTNAKHVLLMNPDTELLSGWTDLAALLDEPGIGAACGALIGPHGDIQHGFNVRALPTPWTLAFEALGLNRIWPSSPVNRRYRAPLEPDKPAAVEQPAGAFLAFRRSVWSELGGFDERFWPAWFEDVDFCKRVARNGYRIWYTPAAKAKHLGGASVSQMHWADRERFWYSNLLRYALKHYSIYGRAITTAGVVVGCLLRAIWSSLRRFSLAPVAVYSRVVWFACLHWLSLAPVKPVERERTFIWKGLQLRD